MRDSVIKGDGTSKNIKFNSLPSTYDEFVSNAETGLLTCDVTVNSSGYNTLGTSLNKANLVPDNIVADYGVTTADPTVADVLAKGVKVARVTAFNGTVNANSFTQVNLYELTGMPENSRIVGLTAEVNYASYTQYILPTFINSSGGRILVVRNLGGVNVTVTVTVTVFYV